VKRLLWFSLGWISLGLGLLGAFLPILPTTPFMLLSAAAFAKSSPRLHRWIVEHPTFGPPVRDWHAHGAISRRAKLMATAAMGAVLLLSLLLRLRWEVLAVQALCLVGAGAFILSRPDSPADARDDK